MLPDTARPLVSDSTKCQCEHFTDRHSTVVQEAMNYHSIEDLQDYFDSASAIVYEAFPKQVHGGYFTKEQRGACLSYIPHGAQLSLQFATSHRLGPKDKLKG